MNDTALRVFEIFSPDELDELEMFLSHLIGSIQHLKQIESSPDLLNMSASNLINFSKQFLPKLKKLAK